MAYVEDNLVPGENILYKANLHWGMFVGPVILLGTGLLLTIISLLPLVSSTNNGDNSSASATIGCFTCCAGPILLIGFIYLVSAFMSYISTEFALTDRRIIAKTGILQQRSLELMIGKVESIGVNQPLLGRVLNFGTIVVCGTGGTKQPFHNIADPMSLRQRINSQMINITE
jgi:uncharacterized membrane protein YdbT with pleckstrin-like domain